MEPLCMRAGAVQLGITVVSSCTDIEVCSDCWRWKLHIYNALSLILTGTEQFTNLIRLLCAYALVKHKDTMISAVADAVPSNTEASHEQMYQRTLVEDLQIVVWGIDSQLFPLSQSFTITH